ncbi:MAG: putative sulfate exporter family transporter [Thermodesulfobacteriota bacterium]|nr:putative sulfate exporter family transporter [Thermodesulfobacteriota bacterium]
MDSVKNRLSPIPGWFLMLAIALFSSFLSQVITIGTRHPLESVTIAILLGLLLKNLFSLPPVFNPGLSRYEVALKSGIVLLGIGLSFFALLEIGTKAITVVVLCLLIAPILFFFIGGKAGLSEKMNILIGIGTTICGSTAIAITAPLIEAEGDDVSYAIATISLFGLAAMFLFPLVAKLLGLNQSIFGLWAGTAIHATPQVVAAGYMYGEVAGQVSTVAKLTRNIFMAPAVFLIGLWYMKKRLKTAGGLSKKGQYSKAIPLFLFGFVAMAIIRTIGDAICPIPAIQWQWLVQHINGLGKFLVLVAMAGIGLNTKLTTMRRTGPKPFLVGLVASILLAIISLLLIHILRIS